MPQSVMNDAEDTGSPPKSFQFLMQRFCAAVQSGNAACALGPVPDRLRPDDLFSI